MVRSIIFALFAFMILAPMAQAGEDEEALLAADRAAHRALVARKGDGWGEFSLPEVVTGFGVGRDQSVAGMNKFLATPGNALDWKPIYAHNFGDVGVTSGSYVAASVDSDGKPHRTTGHYVTLWRRTEQGWKFVWDGDAKNHS